MTESQGTFSAPQSEPISQAERLNGVQWQGKAYFKETVGRRFEFNEGGSMRRGPWSDWVDIGSRNWATLTLVKQRDRWSFEIDFRDPNSLERDPCKAARYRVSCATALANSPFSTFDGKTVSELATIDPLAPRPKEPGLFLCSPSPGTTRTVYA